ncbi:PC4-domain-containing protein [Viridothelium virens]|uniref:PC4-domain-containing protein n=1 Tax=Viridothelium virens TaxID=1048519 RepID=A0A6A6H8X2_VIRVR|nr:PC4-domain-containing protein [Viridothelium virens]
MPSTASRKRAADQDTYEEDDFVENDDGRATKKSKRDKTSSGVSRASVRLGVQKDDDGLEYWELSKNRRVGISEFKGKRMINIREYYEKDGKSLPGKKGISLPIDQFTAFVEALPAIERVLRDKGETVPRPKFDDVGDDVEQDQKDDEEGSEEADDKKNFEATSDEDD